MARKKFFIYSMVRSGSAWLSVFLSQYGSFCYHEPFADMGFDSLDKLLSSRPEPAAGAIDTSAYKVKDLRLPSNYAVYALFRSKNEIEQSLKLKGWLMDLSAEALLFDNVTQLLPRIYHMHFQDLAYLRSIWEQIVGTPIDLDKAMLLKEMNIQRSWQTVSDRLKARA